MSNIVAMQQGKNLPALPDHLWDAPEKANEDLKSGVGGSLAPPRLSIDGGVFRVITATEERALTRIDPETGVTVPIPALPVILVASNHGRYKTFFAEQTAEGTWKRKAYDPKGEVSAPVCYSYDGERPSMLAQAPQCASCAACPNNVMGSAVNDLGTPTKACSDGKLIAVLPYAVVKAQVDPSLPQATAYQFKVSPTALSRNKEDRKNNPTNNTSLAEYIQLLEAYPLPNGQRRSVPAQAVVTTLFFDNEVSYPLVRFRINGFLTPAEHAYVKMRAEGDDVKALISELGVPSERPAPVAVAQAPRPAAIAAPVQAPVPVQAPLPPQAPAVEQPIAKRRPGRPVKEAAATPPLTPTVVTGAAHAAGGTGGGAADPDPFAEVMSVPVSVPVLVPQQAVAPRPAANGAQAGMPQVATTPKDVDAELAELGNLWT